MKRIVIALCLIFSLIVCLPACEQVIEENPEFEILEAVINTEHSSYTIDISVEFPEGTLNEKYEVIVSDGEYKVDYHIERFSGFDVDQNGITAPGSYISTSEGTLTGDDALSYKLPEFNFSYGCLTSDVIFLRTFRADITSMKAFVGMDVEATDATVEVEYTSSAVRNIIISYVNGDGNAVTITYDFQ